METRAVMVVVLLGLALPLSAAGEIATVKTTSGSVIQGEVQGIVVAKAVRETGEVDYAVFRGQDIRSIDNSGIVAVSVARKMYRRIPRSEPGGDLPLPPDSVSAWIIQITGTWTQPTEAIRLPILGELQGPSDGKTATAARILPTLRVRTAKGEVSVPVTRLPRPTPAKLAVLLGAGSSNRALHTTAADAIIRRPRVNAGRWPSIDGRT